MYSLTSCLVFMCLIPHASYSRVKNRRGGGQGRGCHFCPKTLAKTSSLPLPPSNSRTVGLRKSIAQWNLCTLLTVYCHIITQLLIWFIFCRERISCDSVKYSDLLVAPSYEQKKKICHLQQQPLLYSCVSFSTSHMRLCPCRDYIKDQVALCKDCW